jgi:hypothetical protein
MHSRLSSQMLFVAVLLPVLPAAAQTATGPGNQACPSITVSCPSDFRNGDTIVFQAHVEGGDPNAKPEYHWEVSAGTIIQGQGSPSITVDTTGIGGQTPTGTITITGFSSSCASTASCTLAICEGIPWPTKLNSYGTLPKREVLRRLSAFATHLEQQPGAQGYILVYNGRHSRAGEAQELANQSRDYLVLKRRMDAGRIVTVDGGTQEKLTIELWLVPVGASPPPSPGIN